MLSTWQTPPFNKGGPGKMQKSCKRGDPEHFGLVRRDLGFFFMFSWRGRGRGELGPFLVGAVPPLPAMHLQPIAREIPSYVKETSDFL